MAEAKDPSSVLKKARMVEDHEFQELCIEVLGVLRGQNRGSDCTSQLRRLFLLTAATRRKRRVPTDLVKELQNVVAEPQQGSKKIKLLCSTILREISPTRELVIANVDPPVDQSSIPILLPLIYVQGKELGCWSNHFTQMIRWITGGGIPAELQTVALVCLNNVFFSYNDLISQDDIGLICHQVAHWLRHASTVSAPNPYQRQLFGSSRNKGYQAVSEIDGTVSRFFYTILNIAHYSFPDQVLNIYSFSLLRSWLLNTGAVQDQLDQGPVYTQQEGTSPVSFAMGSPSRSPVDNITQSPSKESLAFQDSILKRSQNTLDNISIGSQCSLGMVIPPMSQSPISQMTSPSPTGSLGSRSQTPLSFPLTAEDPDDRPQSQSSSNKGVQRKFSRKISFSNLYPQQGPKTGQQELRERSCEYCLRVLEQSERRSTKLQDSQLVEAGLIEAVLTLDVLCSHDKTLVPKLIEIIKRIYSRVTTDMNRWNRAVLSVVQFLLNHGESVVFDPEPACKAVFSTMVNAFYFRASFSFEVIMFCLDNIEKLCSSSSVFTKYFPNLFKILAWSPRTFLREFLQILPVMMSEDTVVEVFHSILDLPCLSASLCTVWAARVRSTTEAPSSRPASVDAFLDPKHRPLFSFILRPEAGHGDTISRLKVLHSLLEDMTDHPRVVVSSQVAPPLLNVYFSTLMNEAEMDTISKLIPVILERSALLYNIQTFKLDIRRILAEKLVVTFTRYPCLVATNFQDLLDFITGFKNLGSDKEEFFINLVWSIGEFASTAYERGCTVQMIVQYFETIEALTYEILMQTAPGKVLFSGKLVSVFMTTLAKLASRCQDLIQRAILCCSKVVRQKPELLSDPECYDDLVIRAQELIQLLKLPNVAPVILSPDSEWVTGRWHKDKNTSLPLLLQTTKLLVS